MKSSKEIAHLLSEPMRQAIGAKVKAARVSANLKQSDLKRLTGLSVTTISRLEKGHQLPHGSNLESVARVLKISFDDIFAKKFDEKTQEKSDLVLDIIGKLSALKEDELRAILDMVNASPSLRLGLSRASNK